jgi:FtsP/CotA-like multicopper oxidase with cupredoxin domain
MERSRSLRVANALAWVLIATGTARAAYADSVTLQAVADNTIYEESGDLSNGAGDHFFTGATRDGVTRRALIRFDVAASVPVGSTIESVTLQLYLSRTRTQNQTVSLYRVLAAWGEGTSKAGGEEGAGAPATPGDATWTDRLYPTTPWSTAGGDFAASASAAAVVGNGTGFFTWASPGMAADVQAWLDGAAADDGWILLGNEASTRVTKRFDSRTNPDATHRPQLVVEFTPPAATGACCAADGSCSVVLDPGTGCAGSYEGVGTSCSPNPCPPPTGACCLPVAAATCLEDTEDACVTQGGVFQGALSACAATSCPVVLEPFVDALPIPAPAQPTSGTVGGAASYTISMREVQQKLHRDLPPTTVWGFGDGPSGATYPGPTLEARTGQPITVTWVNDLRDTSQPGAPLRTAHYLAVDSCPHGAAGNADARTVVHLHGGHVASEFDGNPEATFPPGAQAVYSYPNWQLPATLWYHDHALGITRLNVEMGLAGFYLIRDAFETSLGLPSGEFEIPLVVQDRTFAPDGSLVYPVAWQDHFFGDTILVNGKVWPYLQVKQGKYRFRLLDGSGSRTYRLSLSSGAPLQVIGMEGGLLPAPVAVNEVTLGPGERADVVVDFAPYPPGTEVFLVNDAPAPFPGEPGVGVVPDVMKFVVSGEAGSTAPLPATLRPMAVLDEADAARSREFHLEKGPADACSPFRWLVRSVENGTVVGEDWVDVTELPELGTTEVWKFVNKSGLTHPMHMHLVMFQVLDRQAFEIVGGDVVPIGSPVPPPPHEAGWKDTVQVGPNEIVRVIARFEDFAGRFPYHCHILEHEDHEMMRQFETVATTPACENGIDDDGDGRIDFAGGDPGCDAATDVSEHAPNRPCDDGLDNDGDGAADFPADPGCGGPGASREDPQCQDGLDNDHDGSIDFDGGASVFGTAIAPADPQCNSASRNSEIVVKKCGLGFEVGVAIPLLAALRRRRRQRGA